MLLECKNVSYFYKSNKEKIILDKLNVGFEQGKVYAIVGSSGAGKTTFLSLLAGLDSPTEGKILYNNVNILNKGLNYYRKNYMSLVFQNYNLIDYLTPIENVKLGGKCDAIALLEKVGIKEEKNRNVMKLSGGQQQRVAIARALASNAKILLADEPTGNLDEKTAKDIIELLKYSAYNENKCVIVVTHSKEFAINADKIYRLENGNLLEV